MIKEFLIKRKKVLILTTVVLSVILVILIAIWAYITYFKQGDNNQQENPNVVDPISSSAKYLLESGSEIVNDTDYESVSSNESAIIVKNNAIFELNRSLITKSGDTTSTVSSDSYGLNSAVLAATGGKITINDSTIACSGEGSNGVFSTGLNSLITLNNVNITVKENESSGAVTTQDGELVLSKVNIKTIGSNAPAIYSDKNGGQITLSSSKIDTTGLQSPGILANSNMVIRDTQITSSASESIQLRGGNTLTLNNTFLTSTQDRKWGVLITQGASSNNDSGSALLDIAQGEITFKSNKGSMFYITNTTAEIKLFKTILNNSAPNLLTASSITETDQVGTFGGVVKVRVSSQQLTGDIVGDNLSTIDIYIKDSSSYFGTINKEKSAKSVNIELDNTSTLTLSGDSYVNGITGLELARLRIDNVFGKGFTLYYEKDNPLNEYLGGKNFVLSEKGSLVPY